MKSHHIIYAIVILAIFSVCFYWFEIKPAYIRAKCEQSAISDSEKLKMSDDTTVQYFYQECLHLAGLQN